MTNFFYGLLMIAISFAGSFILTIVFGFKDEPEEGKVQKRQLKLQNQKLSLWWKRSRFLRRQQAL